MEAEPDSKEQAIGQDEQAVNHVEQDPHQENTAPATTKEETIEETAEPDDKNLTSTNENTVAAS